MGDHAITLSKDDSAGAAAAIGFDGMFDAHHEKVMVAAYRVTGNMQDAEDVLQTVFLRLLKNRQHLDSANNPAGYLCKAAINASLDLLRARTRHPTEQLFEESHSSGQGAADGAARQAELRQHLRAAMLTLDKRSAQIFALREFEDFSYADIATLLDTTSNSVAVTLHKARARLQEQLGPLQGGDQ